MKTNDRTPLVLGVLTTLFPALIILALQIMRRVTDYRITDKAPLTSRDTVQD